MLYIRLYTYLLIMCAFLCAYTWWININQSPDVFTNKMQVSVILSWPWPLSNSCCWRYFCSCFAPMPQNHTRPPKTLNRAIRNQRQEIGTHAQRNCQNIRVHFSRCSFKVRNGWHAQFVACNDQPEGTMLWPIKEGKLKCTKKKQQYTHRMHMQYVLRIHNKWLLPNRARSCRITYTRTSARTYQACPSLRCDAPHNTTENTYYKVAHSKSSIKIPIIRMELWRRTVLDKNHAYTSLILRV